MTPTQPQDRTAELDPRACGARRFSGRIAVVAGAGQGIGSATARRLAAEGATVVVADAVRTSSERVVEELTRAGAPASPFVGDLTERATAEGLIQGTFQRYGRVDVLVNVVGGTIWQQPFQDYTPEQVESEIRKSFWAPFWLCWAAVPVMIEQGYGAIVNLGSHALFSVDRVPYAAAKGGVIALTRSLAHELAPSNIRVNCVAPHSTSAADRVTPRNPHAEPLRPEEAQVRAQAVALRREREIPMGRQGTAEEQAAAIAFVASEDASFITGQVIPVGGGATFA